MRCVAIVFSMVMAMTKAAAEYAKKFHALLTERAELNEYGELVFHGSLTKLYDELGASTTYYTPIRSALIETQSIEITKQGAGKQLSEVTVKELSEKISPDPLTPAPDAATLTAGVERRLLRLEAWRETTGGLNIVEALRNMELRLSKLEAHVGETGGKA